MLCHDNTFPIVTKCKHNITYDSNINVLEKTLGNLYLHADSVVNCFYFDVLKKENTNVKNICKIVIVLLSHINVAIKINNSVDTHVYMIAIKIPINCKTNVHMCKISNVIIVINCVVVFMICFFKKIYSMISDVKS